MHKTIEPGTPSQANTLQIPIAQAKQNRNICCIPAVSSPEDYPTPAPNADSIRRPVRDGRHLIILNNSGHSRIGCKRVLRQKVYLGHADDIGGTAWSFGRMHRECRELKLVSGV